MTKQADTLPENAVAIIGMAGRFPDAPNIDTFWKNLVAERESISFFTDEQLEGVEYKFDEVRDDPNFVRGRGVLEGIELFDANFFGYTPREAAVLDPQQRLWLECAWEALERASVAPAKFPGHIGVFAGSFINTYLLYNIIRDREFIEKLVRFRAVDAFQNLVSNDKDYLTTRTSYKFNLTGPSVTVQTACSTSLVAVCQAVQSLLHYESDICLAGGACISLPQEKGYLYQEGAMVSPDGHCRTFDAGAKGTVFSNGLGVVVLKRLEDAVADGDHIHATILGAALNNDGSKKVSYTAPSVDGQADVIAMAQALANVDPSTITMVEAHGTATPLGDPIEVAGLTKAFRQKTDAKQFCALGSVKSNIGHLDSAAGVAGLLKLTHALEHKTIPASLHYETPNPEIDFENSPFYVPTKTQPWEAKEHPRRGGVSSFGVGGTNAHVVLEEGPEAPPSGPSRAWQLLPLSAKTETALAKRAEELGQYLSDAQNRSLADVAYTLQVGRHDFEHRGFVVAADPKDAVEALSDSKRWNEAFFDGSEPSVVFMFPGQGAQHVDMGKGLYESEPTYRACVDECAEILEKLLGQDIRTLMFPEEGDEEEAAEQLKQTAITQPALFVIEYALAKLWMEWGINPSAMIGHSVGEYVAACLAGVFSLEDALGVLAERARLMQEQPSGAMLAVRLSEEDIKPYLGEEHFIAACNAPKLTVVSGTHEAIEALEATLKAAKVGSKALHTSHAFHSDMMDPALEPLTERVRQATLNKPNLPFVSSLTGTWITDEEATDPAYWSKQLRHSVRFSQGIQTLQQEPGRVFLEVGPSKTLSTLTLQHAGKDIKQTVVASLGHAQETLEDGLALLQALGKVWQAGVQPDWPSFYQEEQRRKLILPSYPFERQRYWVDPPALVEGAGTSVADVLPLSNAPAMAGTPEEDVDAEPMERDQRILQTLQALIYDLSGIELTDKDPETTFMELGLDSLFLTQASAEIQSTFKVKITFRQLLEDYTSLAELTAFLDSELPEDAFTAPAPQAAVPAESAPDGAAASAFDLPDAPPSHVEKAETGRFGPYKKIEKARDGGLTGRQREHLDTLVNKLTNKTRESKRLAQAYREVLADPRSVAGFRVLWKELVYQVVAQRSEGSKLWDVDGNEYTCITMCFGANLLGYNPPYIREAVQEQLDKGFEIGPQSPLAGEVAELAQYFTQQQRHTFCNTGSEAVMAAMRIARTVSGRDRIAFFSGDYHGMFDEVLAREQVMRGKVYTKPAAPGIPEHSVERNLVLDYGNPESLDILRQFAPQLAAILVEPIQSRHPDNRPKEFVRELRKICDEAGCALIFDEVITGFRLHPQGAQNFYGVRPDLATYGKILGGGMPIGMVAGQHEYMDCLDGGGWEFGDESVPEADVTFFAGTFVRHPLALAAARATLQHLKEEGPELQEKLNARTTAFADDLNEFLVGCGVPLRINHCSSWFRFDYPYDLTYAQLLLYQMLEKGVYIREAGQNCFFSTAHSEADIAHVSQVIKESVTELQEAGFFPDGRAHDGLAPAALGKQAIPLTEAQKEIWLGAKMGDRASCAFNESFRLDLKGKLDVGLLREAVGEIIERHEALHYTFNANGDFQYLHRATVVGLEVEDLSTSKPEEQVARLDTLIREEGLTPFNLEKGPLYRVQLVRLSDEHHVFLFTAHHIVCDGWSTGVVLEELGKRFSSLQKGAGEELPAPERFSEYAAEFDQRYSAEEMEEGLAYWRNEYQTLPPPLELPMDHPRPAKRSYEGNMVTVQYDPALMEGVREMAKQQHATLFTTLLASYGLLLHRLSGVDDLVMAIPSAGQAQAGKKTLVGHCVNLLPLRFQFKPNQTFSDYLKQVKTCVLDAYDHQQCTFGQILRELSLERDPSRPALVEVNFNLDRDRVGVGFGDLEAAVEQNPKLAVHFGLFFNFNDGDDGLSLNCEYNTDIYDESTVRRWTGYLEQLLRAAVEDPDEMLSTLPLMSAAEEKVVVEEWNQTDTTYEGPATLHQSIEAQAEKTPDATALQFEGATLTYGEMNARANQLARHLVGLGVVVDQPVGVFMERSLELPVALLAILKAGGAYVPLDPGYPQERVAFMLEDTDASVVLTQQSLLPTLPSSQGRKVIAVDGMAEEWAEQSTRNPECDVAANNLAYIIYTSGSTGQPKGAMNEHRGIFNRLQWMQGEYGLGAEDRVLQKTPFSFDVSVWEFFWPLMQGATLVLARPEGHKDTGYLVNLIQKEKITTLHFVPSMLQVFLEEQGASDCTTVKRVLCSGEALSYDVQQRFFERMDSAELHNLYGPTEAAVDVSSWVCQRDSELSLVPIGRPVANTQLYILDAAQRPVPVGVAGELYIGGVQVARGYWNRPELTEERFVQNPLGHKSDQRLYRTGDLARFLPSGDIEFLGRMDFQVKIRGFRVELGEIETVLRQQPGVREAAVLYTEKLLVAYLVADSQVDTGKLQTALKLVLPDYMVPSQTIQLDALPLTPNGKLDRKALPTTPVEVQEKTYDAPEDAIEYQLAALWAKALKLSKVGLHDNFFELGGHSLLAVQLVIEIEKVYGKRLPLATFVGAPTVAQLADVLRREDWQPDWQSLVPIRAGGSKAPLFLMHSHGGNVLEYYPLVKHLDADLPVYALQARGLDGNFLENPSMESMAANYIQEMRQLQPTGPYYLAGFCFGGLMAMEVAQQLKTAGQKVAFLGMIQSAVPGQVEYLPGVTWFHKVAYGFSKRWNLEASNFQVLENHEKHSYLFSRAIRIRDMLLARMEIVLEPLLNKMGVEVKKDSLSYILEALSIMHDKAYDSYRPRPYHGDVHVFPAREQLKGLKKDPALGWGGLVEGSLATQEVPGHQQNLLKEPRVKETARLLEQSMTSTESGKKTIRVAS